MALTKALVLFFLAVSHLDSICSATKFYVSPDHHEGQSRDDNSTAIHFTDIITAKNAVRNAISAGQKANITVFMSDGIYYLDTPLHFSSADSGSNGYTVTWKATGTGATISGGLKVTNWTKNDTTGIYSANVPKNTQSRNLYVNGWAANYARAKLDRKYLTFTNTSVQWTTPNYDWLMTTPGMANAELRSINSFTDRYAPIKAVGNRELIMVQDCWKNQVIGWDDFVAPFSDFGVWIQNSLALLDEGGEYYLDSDAGIVYYMPLKGEDLSKVDTYLGIQEALVVISGSYDDPAQLLSFEGLNFAHTTWLKPGQGYGYVDQQTGGYIGENVTYPEFEAARSHWYQMPSAIQVSAARDIRFDGGSYQQLGGGGFGIGNDHNAHLSGVGLGAKNVSVTNGYFTQVMGNSITGGGINIPAHHPNDTRLVNSGIYIERNIFYNTSSLFSSTVPILFTYVQDSTVKNNDLFHVPYSGICIGYGWGMNDEGGSQTYVDRGTYKYQPIFNTPTTARNNLIEGNLINDFGWSHTDLGGIYTLSKSPDTIFRENYVLNSTWYGLYTDEGSNSYIFEHNDFLPGARNGSGFGWYNPNQGFPANPGMHTANNTLTDNFGLYPSNRDFTNAPHGSGVLNNTFLRNFIVPGLTGTTIEGQRVAYRAGITPGARGGRPISNPRVADSGISLEFPSNLPENLVVKLWNFDDAPFSDVSFNIKTDAHSTVNAVQIPNGVPADSSVNGTWKLSSDTCSVPSVSIVATYTNTRTNQKGSISINGTMPGLLPLNQTWHTSSTWPASFGQLCNSIGIRTSGRDVNGSYDDWAAVYKPSAIGSSGSISARVSSINAVDASSKAGVVVRNSFNTSSPSNDASHLNSTGYAAVMVTPSQGVVFAWDTAGNGYLRNSSSVPAVRPPVWVRLSIANASASGYYSLDGKTWSQVGSRVTLTKRASRSDAGVLSNAHTGFVNGTAIFEDISFQ
ncbi:pectin lyase fold virulence factor protein [Rutstroemia sp. NJR-2017a WRK4]|nr:pectin lyase fold virulence factor protein [Rutstroemia sp. NJR-2017a WRK4]